MKQIDVFPAKKAFVDDEDFEKIKNKSFYCNPFGIATTATRLDNGKRGTISLPRLILNPNKNEKIILIDGNKLNCQKNNLKIMPKKGYSSPRKPKPSKMGFVCEVNKSHRRIFMDGKTKPFFLNDSD